jgi:hypothetical protein
VRALQAGRVYRWRMVQASTMKWMDLSLNGTGCHFGIYARDGIFLRGFPRLTDHVVMSNANRCGCPLACLKRSTTAAAYLRRVNLEGVSPLFGSPVSKERLMLLRAAPQKIPHGFQGMQMAEHVPKCVHSSRTWQRDGCSSSHAMQTPLMCCCAGGGAGWSSSSSASRACTRCRRGRARCLQTRAAGPRTASCCSSQIWPPWSWCAAACSCSGAVTAAAMRQSHAQKDCTICNSCARRHACTQLRAGKIVLSLRMQTAGEGSAPVNASTPFGSAPPCMPQYPPYLTDLRHAPIEPACAIVFDMCQGQR